MCDACDLCVRACVMCAMCVYKDANIEKKEYLFFSYCSGRGKKFFACGDEYVGEWRFDRPHGTGTYTWKNGDRYEVCVRELSRGGGGGRGEVSGAVFMSPRSFVLDSACQCVF